MNARRPSIFQVGKVTEDTAYIRIYGWGLGLCAARCPCHRVDANGGLAIEQSIEGRLGLVSTPVGGEPCTCCEPWHAEELAAILRDLETLSDVVAVDKPIQKEEQP